VGGRSIGNCRGYADDDREEKSRRVSGGGLVNRIIRRNTPLLYIDILYKIPLIKRKKSHILAKRGQNDRRGHYK
jgi:hypothetical protein